MGKPGIRDVAAAAEGAVRNKLGKPAETPPRDPFRLGQTLTVDPSYFILAAGSLRQPEPPGSLSVTAIGTFDGVPLTRLLFPGDRFALAHLSDAGHVDECRLYQPHDTVQPEGEDGWAFWLPPGAPPEGGGPSEWAIGFPVFETKDGTRWDRVWSPGEDQVEPVEATETVKGLDGTSGRRVSMMLYARDTGGKAPAPAREYLLLSAVRDGAGAEVRIHLGIDVDATPIQPIA